MNQKIDRCWLWLLDGVHLWMLRQVVEHCDREKPGRCLRLRTWRIQLFAEIHPWIIRQAQGVWRREKFRRFQRLMQAPDPHRN